MRFAGLCAVGFADLMGDRKEGNHGYCSIRPRLCGCGLGGLPRAGGAQGDRRRFQRGQGGPDQRRPEPGRGEGPRRDDRVRGRRRPVARADGSPRRDSRQRAGHRMRRYAEPRQRRPRPHPRQARLRGPRRGPARQGRLHRDRHPQHRAAGNAPEHGDSDPGGRIGKAGRRRFRGRLLSRVPEGEHGGRRLLRSAEDRDRRQRWPHARHARSLERRLRCAAHRHRLRRRRDGQVRRQRMARLEGHLRQRDRQHQQGARDRRRCRDGRLLPGTRSSTSRPSTSARASLSAAPACRRTCAP